MCIPDPCLYRHVLFRVIPQRTLRIVVFGKERMMEGRTVEIYFSDLKESAQTEVLEAAGLSSIKETNWDILPLFELYFEEEND